MNNKLFFVTMIISLFIHFWVGNIFANIFDIWKLQERKEQKTPVSTELVFYSSDFFSQPIRGTIDQYWQDGKDSKDISEIIMEEKKDINIEGKNSSEEENDKEEIVQNIINGNLLETKEISEKQENIIENNEIKIKEEEQVIQDDYISIAHEEINKEAIKLGKKLEQREEEIQINEEVLQSSSKEKNKDIINEDKIIPEEKRAVDLFPSSSIEREPINESNQAKQENTTLDFTQSDFGGTHIIPPTIVSFSPPEYPENLRKRGIEGKVQLKVLISREGKVIEVEVYTSSGYQNFDQSAKQSIYQWQFKPAQSGDTKRDSWVLIPIVFRLQ